jgi:ribonuclease HI
VKDEQLPRGVASIGSGRVEVHFDGSCQTIGGVRVAGYGFTVEGAGLDTEECGLAVPPGHPRATNNVAEYVGAICALEYLARVGFAGEVAVVGDSELVIRQTNGEYSVRAEHLVPYAHRLQQLAAGFRRAEFRWVPREANQRADALSKRAIGEAAAEPQRPAGLRGRRMPDAAPDDQPQRTV